MATPARVGHPFDRVRGRYVFSWLVCAMLLALVPLSLLPALEEPSDLPWSVYGVCASLLIGLFPLIAAWKANMSLERLYGARPSSALLAGSAALAIPSVGMSFLSVYAVFAPLALVAPSFVDVWLFEYPVVLFRLSGSHFALANVLDFLTVVVMAPIAEESVFRGVLFTRWSRKWNVRAAAIASSVVFALFHTDWLGSFLFALIATELYSRTGSLLAPTIFHMSNNFIIWALGVADVLWRLPASLDSASQLPAAWWLPALGAALVLPSLAWLRQAVVPKFRLPPYAA